MLTSSQMDWKFTDCVSIDHSLIPYNFHCRVKDAKKSEKVLLKMKSKWMSQSPTVVIKYCISVRWGPNISLQHAHVWHICCLLLSSSLQYWLERKNGLKMSDREELWCIFFLMTKHFPLWLWKGTCKCKGNDPSSSNQTVGRISNEMSRGIIDATLKCAYHRLGTLMSNDN